MARTNKLNEHAKQQQHNPNRSRDNFSSAKKSDQKTNLQKTNLNSDLTEYYNHLRPNSLMPSTSWNSKSSSGNFITRLDELSSPVTRKLKFWNKKSLKVNQYDPTYKVIYLGNLSLQFLSKDAQCLEKPLKTLWNNYSVVMKTDIVMLLTICNSGLKAITRQHGLTQYWANRLVYCFTHNSYPKIFSWIYRHEGKKMRQELRCHAVLCSSADKASKMVITLNQRLACALREFRREKKSSEPPSIMKSCDPLKNTDTIQLIQQTLPRTMPLRRQMLAKGLANFRPPLDRSRSAPKLTAIREEEDYKDSESEENEDVRRIESFKHEYDFEMTFDDDDNEDDDSFGVTRGEKLKDTCMIPTDRDAKIDDLGINLHPIESTSDTTGEDPDELESSSDKGEKMFDRNSSFRLSMRDSSRGNRTSKTAIISAARNSDSNPQEKTPMINQSQRCAQVNSADSVDRVALRSNCDSLSKLLTERCNISSDDDEFHDEEAETDDIIIKQSSSCLDNPTT